MDSDSDMDVFVHFNDNDSDDEIHCSPAEVVEMLEEAWVNEKFAPEILPHKSEVVEIILGQITHMEENLESLESSDFKKSIHQLEVDRLRFLMTSYLRTRLEKIETYTSCILEQEDQRIERREDTYLTENELEFARNYLQNFDQHFENVTSFYPGLPKEDWRNQPVVPNLHSFVFLKSKSKIDGIKIDDGYAADEDVVDLKEGSQIIISYTSVTNLIKNGQVHLI